MSSLQIYQPNRKNISNIHSFIILLPNIKLHVADIFLGSLYVYRNN